MVEDWQMSLYTIKSSNRLKGKKQEIEAHILATGLKGSGLWCLTPLSTIFQLYQFLVPYFSYLLILVITIINYHAIFYFNTDIIKLIFIDWNLSTHSKQI